MRKRNFIKRFLYYTGIITIPIITLCFIFMAVIVYRKQQDIETEAIKSAQAVRDNYSLVLDSAATPYALLARNPRMSISLRNYSSHKQIGYLAVSYTHLDVYKRQMEMRCCVWNPSVWTIMDRA